jgi:hypothetical protein
MKKVSHEDLNYRKRQLAVNLLTLWFGIKYSRNTYNPSPPHVPQKHLPVITKN